ncbi:hypothetical protein [Crossiella sp. CA198]|uniref:hypothetical protein n=1 Tax=Crossiella sp. CA198 TaxID=3455607 RepID=UPI003F8CFCD8
MSSPANRLKQGLDDLRGALAAAPIDQDVKAARLAWILATPRETYQADRGRVRTMKQGALVLLVAVVAAVLWQFGPDAAAGAGQAGLDAARWLGRTGGALWDGLTWRWP